MSEESSYFLVPASSGLAIQPKNSGIFTAEIDGSKQQQWYCERENGGKIAFRNAENHLYLRVPGGHKGAKATVGKKQFFTLEPSNTPNAFWLKCEDFPNAYLCNSYGKYTKDNLIYMWAHESYWTQTMLWYIHDYKSWSEHKTFPISKPDSSSEVEAKELAIAEKQRRAEVKEQELKAREAELVQAHQQAAAANSERLLQQKQLAEARKALEARQEALSEREKSLEAREKTVSNSKGPANSNSTASDSKEISRLQQQLEDARAELQKAQTSEKNITEVYKALQDRREGTGTETNSFGSEVGEPGKIFARRVHSEGREPLAATVGNRTEPPGLRTSRMITEGDVKPVVMQRHFSMLPRLS